MEDKTKLKSKKSKKRDNSSILSEELKQALGGTADIIVDNKVSREEKRRKKMKEEKLAKKAEQKGKRAKKREELEVMHSFCV